MKKLLFILILIPLLGLTACTISPKSESDGNSGAFAAFCRDNYIADPDIRHKTAIRFENALESIYGYYSEMGRDLGWHLTIETGPVLPIDYAFASFSPGAHLSEDLFQSKIAHIALLNFPLNSLETAAGSSPMIRLWIPIRYERIRSANGTVSWTLGRTAE